MTVKNILKNNTYRMLLVCAGFGAGLLGIFFFALNRAFAAVSAEAVVDPKVTIAAFFAAAVAAGVGSLAAGIAVAYVGSAAIGAIGEKPELAGRVLIFVGLAEGIAIYGLIIAIMILGKV